MEIERIQTTRLLLRRWQPGDAAPMAAINRDPEVTRYLNRPVDAAAVAGFYDLMTGHWRENGYGPWAVESVEPFDHGTFLGFVGLALVPPFLAESAGRGPELGWRLARSAWGRGLATEAALAARDDAFGRLGMTHLMSIIHPDNERSARVAAKIGMLPCRSITNLAIGRSVDLWKSTPP